MDKTIKNWKWWVVLPLALPIITLLLMPKTLIFLLEGYIEIIKFLDVGNIDSKWSKKLVSWVRK